MKIQLKYPFSQDWKKGYLVTNREDRQHVILFNSDKDRTTISYARYLMSVYLKKYIEKGYEVDHINNDKTDDRLENLQVLTTKENREKQRLLKPKRIVKMICPICNKEFVFEARNLSTRPNPCCSRKCGGKKAFFTRTIKSISKYSVKKILKEKLKILNEQLPSNAIMLPKYKITKASNLEDLSFKITCPICLKVVEKPYRNIRGKKVICCSRSCGASLSNNKRYS